MLFCQHSSIDLFTRIIRVIDGLTMHDSGHVKRRPLGELAAVELRVNSGRIGVPSLFARILKINWNWAEVVVVKWSACLPSTPMIRVWILLKTTVFSLKFLFEKNKNKQQKRSGLAHFLNKNQFNLLDDFKLKVSNLVTKSYFSSQMLYLN